MFITKKHPNGGAPLKTFPLRVDPSSGLLGYKVGYHPCPCGRTEPVFIRTVDVTEIVDRFGVSDRVFRQKILDRLPALFG